MSPQIVTLKVDKTSTLVPMSVLGYEIKFDFERKLWFCDIEIDGSYSYFPFIKLSISRFQPKSIEYAFISTPVKSEFMQLQPERFASVIYNSNDSNHVIIIGTGIFPNGPHGRKLIASLETKPKGNPDDLWVELDVKELNYQDGFSGEKLEHGLQSFICPKIEIMNYSAQGYTKKYCIYKLMRDR